MSNERTNLRIELTSGNLGIENLSVSVLREMSEATIVKSNILRNLIASVIERGPDPDFAGVGDAMDPLELDRMLRKKFADMKIRIDGNHFVMENVPTSALTLNASTGLKDVSYLRKQQIVHALRDICLLPKGAKTAPEVVKAMIERTGILHTDPRPRTTVWGGHRVSKPDYEYAKNIGYWDATVNNTEFITGSGSDMMKAPFSGAIPAYIDAGILGDRKCIGFTEIGIMVSERSNSLINSLVIFENISLRMMGFIAAGHRIRTHDGGVGSMQEVLRFLSIISHEKNQGIKYPFDLVGRTSKSILAQFHEFFNLLFGKENVDEYLKFHFGVAGKEYAEYVAESNKELDFSRLYNDEIYFPEYVFKPATATFEAIESLDFSPANHSFSSFANEVEKFFNMYVELTSVRPEQVEAWGDERPVLKGDKKIVESIISLLDRMIAEKRLYAPNGTRLFRASWE